MNFDRMRALLLDQAIRGELDEGNPTDSVVPVVEGCLKKESYPFEVPDSWRWYPLGKILEYGKATQVSSDQISETTWVLDLEDIEKGTGRLVTKKRGTPTTSNKAKFSKGDVLYGKLRPYLNKVVIADEAGVCTTEIVPINVKNAKVALSSEYLKSYLMSPYFLDYANKISYGVKMPRLGTKDAKAALIPVPPIEEQVRIVAKLDEAITEIDRAEKAYRELQTLSGVLRGQILQEAIQGKLVPQLEEEGTVKSLVEGPFELPKSWGWQKFEAVLLFENGDRGANYPAKSTLTQDPISGHPFVSAINLKNGHIDKDGLLYLSTEQQKKLRSGHIKSGDCLFCIRGSLGKFGFAKTDGGAIASSLVILRRKDPTTLREKFLSYLLQSPFFDQCIKDRSNGTAQPNLGAKELKGFFFPLPPVQEQDRIVAKVEELLKQVDALSGE